MSKPFLRVLAPTAAPPVDVPTTPADDPRIPLPDRMLMQAVSEYLDLERNDHPAWEIEDENDPEDPMNRLALLRAVARDSVARSLWRLDAKARLLQRLSEAFDLQYQEAEIISSLAADIARLLEEEKGCAT